MSDELPLQILKQQPLLQFNLSLQGVFPIPISVVVPPQELQADSVLKMFPFSKHSSIKWLIDAMASS